MSDSASKRRKTDKTPPSTRKIEASAETASRTPPDESLAYGSCRVCNQHPVASPYPSFKLDCACTSKICASCFSTSLSATNNVGGIECQLCKTSTTKWEVSNTPILRNNRQGAQRTVSHSLKTVETVLDPDMDPVRYHCVQSDPFFGVTLTYWDEMTKAFSHRTHKFLKNGDCNEWSEEQVKFLESLCKILHVLTINNDLQHRTPFDPLSATTSSELFSVASSDLSPLNRCVFSLTYGKELIETLGKIEELPHKGWKRLVTQAFAASDIVRNAARNSIGVLKSTLSQQMRVDSTSDRLFDLTGEFGISLSRTSVRLNEQARAAEKIKEGIDLKKISRYAMVILLYDNVGFKVRAGRRRKVGYDQYTKIIWIVVTPRELIDLKIYPNPEKKGADIGDLLSRTNAKNWEEEREKEDIGFETVLAPQKKDFERLAQISLSFVDSLLKAESEGRLPTVHESKERLLSTQNFQFQEPIPDVFSSRVVDIEEQPTLIPCHDPEESLKAETPLDVNRALIDVPAEKDLNSLEMVEILVDYLSQVKELLLALPDDGPDDIFKDLDDNSKPQPIMEDVRPSAAGDGLPSHMMSKLLKEASELSEKVQVSFGGFHTKLSGCKSNGIFFETHLEQIFTPWRNTEGMINWVKNPGDPNQLEDELTLVIAAFNVSAIRGLVAHRKQIGGSLEISAVDVEEFIIERAREYPIIMVVLMQLRLAEVLLLLDEAESTSDGDCLRTAKRFLNVYFAITHALKYVCLISDEAVEFHCASDADRAIKDNFVLFRKTIGGSSIFSDRFVEWLVRDLRSFLGKYSKGQTHWRTVINTSLLLNERKKIKVKDISKVNKSTANKGLRIDKIFCETLVMLDEMNFFGPGDPVRLSKFCAWRDRAALTNNQRGSIKKGEMKSLDGESGLNPGFLFLYSTGMNRLRLYFETFYMQGDMSDPSRSEDGDEGVTLAKVDPLLTKQNLRRAVDLKRISSLDVEYLKKKGVYKNDELIVELKELNVLLEAQGRARVKVVGNRNKENLSTAVIDARKQLKELDNQFLERRETELQEKFLNDDNITSDDFSERVASELRLPFFSFTATSARANYDSKKYSFGEEVDNRGGTAAQGVGSPGARSTLSARSASTQGFGTQISNTQESYDII